MVQTVLPAFSRVRTWQEHPGVWGKVEENLGTLCRVSLAVRPLEGEPVWSAPSPALWKQEGASNLLNLCVDKLPCSAEEDYPELICLFKLVVVIVTSPLPSSGILSLPSPRGLCARILSPPALEAKTICGGELRTWFCVVLPFLVVEGRAACSSRGPQGAWFPWESLGGEDR